MTTKRSKWCVISINPTAEDLARLIKRGEIYKLQVMHEDDCPTLKTQRETDCSCKVVSTQLWRLER